MPKNVGSVSKISISRLYINPENRYGDLKGTSPEKKARITYG